MKHDKEILPVSMAQTMAWLTCVMSIGLVIVLSVFVVADMLGPRQFVGAVIAMVLLASISTFVALNNVRKKILCLNCEQPFFGRVHHLFVAPRCCFGCNAAPK